MLPGYTLSGTYEHVRLDQQRMVSVIELQRHAVGQTDRQTQRERRADDMSSVMPLYGAKRNKP